MGGYSGAGWSSLAARRAHNPKVAGSNPAPATNFFWDSRGPPPSYFTSWVRLNPPVRSAAFRTRPQSSIRSQNLDCPLEKVPYKVRPV